MLFKPELVAKILAGEKTQTRRVVRGNEVSTGSFTNVDWVQTQIGNDVYRMKWRRGDTYAVQPGRGKPGVARITITAIRYCERARDISEEDAIAEGFANADEFRETYATINGAGALERPCWALSFVLQEARG